MITRITKERVIRRFKTYDLEWIPGTLEVRLVGCYDGNSYTCYSTVEDFLNGELTHRNRGYWYYAHAGGMADIQFVLDSAIQQNRKYKIYKIKACFSGSSAIITKVTRGHNSWWFIDSFWLFRDKLKSIAKFVGMEKGGGSYLKDGDPDEDGITEEEFIRRKRLEREWYATAPFDELRLYNENDNVILWTAIDQFEDALLQLGSQLQMTIASCAMQLFRRKYLSKDIETSMRINRIAKEAYTASRVEVISENVEDALYYDINSSFPAAMTQECPGNYVGTIRYLPDRGAIYLADVTVEVHPDDPLPPLPLRLNGRVFFPVGRWRAWFTSVDIESLVERGGRILQVHECKVFEPFTDLRHYAMDIYQRRQASTDPMHRIVYKYLLNSLYGKFAEGSWKRGLVIDPPNPLKLGDTCEMVMPGVFLEEKFVNVPHVHVPISAHITALARKRLLDYMDECQSVHYCDTDGFSTQTSLGISSDLGGLKLEKIVASGRFIVPKVYEIHGQVLDKDRWKDTDIYHAKGFSRVNAERFNRIVEGKYIEFERMRRIRENLRNAGRMAREFPEGDFPEATKPKEDIINKRLKWLNLFDPNFDLKENVLPKRFTYPDGETRPWQLDELKDML